MRKIIFTALICFAVISLTACIPKKTDSPAVTKPVVNFAASCASANGIWSAKYQECEGSTLEWCQANGGRFNECASACRHDPYAEFCTMQCVLVCEFGPESPSKPAMPETTEPPMLGGDRDEHGCIGSAGYQWCGPKQKCIRIWEEDCDDELSASIKQLFAEKYEKPLSEIRVTVARSSSEHIRGGVMFGEGGIGEGGNFFAAKIDGKWQLIFDGNGSVACEVLRSYGFPDEIMEDFCHE